MKTQSLVDHRVKKRQILEFVEVGCEVSSFKLGKQLLRFFAMKREPIEEIDQGLCDSITVPSININIPIARS
jgi:hypothetical protein